jgi:hypothetical protein
MRAGGSKGIRDESHRKSGGQRKAQARARQDKRQWESKKDIGDMAQRG